MSGCGHELPRRSALVNVGPQEYVDGKVVHYAKHITSGIYFRMGEREAFLLERLNGMHSEEQIAAEYAATFSVKLTSRSLQNALELFAKRGLIEGVSGADTAGDEQPPLGRRDHALSYKLFFWNPDRLMGRLARYFNWLINTPMLALWAGALVVAELALVPHLSALWNDAVRFEASTVPYRLLMMWLIFALVALLHESAHAIACKRHGGEVREMGLLLRYFMLTPYTRIDDILLFPQRTKRVHVLAVGPLVSLTVIPFAWQVWLHAEPGSVVHVVSVDLLVWYNLGALMQLLPFVQSDGYFMFAQLLRMPDLRTDASSYMVRKLLSVASKRRMPPISPRCAAYVVPVCIAYGVSAFAVTGAVIAYVLHWYAKVTLETLGPSSGLFLVVLAGVVLAWRSIVPLIPWLQRQHNSLLPE
jgi:putative peptide zinc metalloprotease protein